VIGTSIPIIVAGMHRSGTSLVASWLSALGVDMGQELLPPDKGNPRGYFEDIGFLEFQRRVLSQCCAPDDGGHPDWGWTESEQLNTETLKDVIPDATSMLVSRAEGRRLWGWKDPRTTLLLDFWDTLLDGAYYIFVYRFPWDVADSMQRLGEPLFLRHPEYAYRIWSFYNRHLRDFFIKNSHRCVLLSTNALRQNPDRLVDLLRKKLNLEIREANLREIYEHELFTCIEGREGYDPLIDLVAATSPECTKLLAELDNLADLSGSGLWRARPLRSSLGAHASSVLPSEAEGVTIRNESEAGDLVRRPSDGNYLSTPHQVDLSVIIPCRDDGQFLIEAIASFERVAPKNCELIVVNDGSTQVRTLEILKILRDAGYCLLDQENQGLSSARNAGISQASGRYILPLDADNRMRAGFVEAAIEILDSTPEIGIVYGYRQFFGMKTGIDEVAEFDLEEMLMFNYIDAGAVFRRQVWADCGGYDQRMSPLEDWDLWISAAEKRWRFHRLPQITFDYRVRPGSLLSMVDNPEFLDHLFESLMTKHYELYQPRFVKQLAKMKRSAAHLTVSFRRLSEENDLLKVQLLAAKSELNETAGMKTSDPAPDPKQLPQPAERPADKLNSRGWRLLSYVRRTMQRRRGS
jgi:glycosyltransferase involved in cell wall biosynthesis